MKPIPALTLLLFIALPALATPASPTAAQIIQRTGQFAFSDGSSYYLFQKDGVFASGPLSLSGRTITGHWTQDDTDEFTVQGRWGWVNGISAINDYRQMCLTIYPLGRDGTPRRLSVMSASVTQVYKCYFVINQLAPIPPPKIAPRKNTP